jgi:hypothetical protein
MAKRKRSTGDSADERRGEAAARPAPQRRALLICNGTFKYLSLRLDGVAKDAASLSKALSDRNLAGFEVTCLLDQGLWTVRKAIAQACATSGPDDTLLIYYSGTSVCDERGELLMPVADSDDQYLFATSIESDFVLAQMRRSECRRFVVIIDGCHSGAFFRNNKGIPDGMIALTSCSADEYSADTPEGGAFTQSLLRALSSGKVIADHDGTITVDDVYEFIRKDPALVGTGQTHPQKWVWNLPDPIVLVRTTMSVFLSYSRTDRAAADALVAALERQGILVWRDISGIPGGAEWRDSLLVAFGKTQALVLLMSEKAMSSKWVRRELEYADSKGLPIVPVCGDEVTTPEWFKLQFGGLQRQQIEVRAIDAAAPALAAMVRAAVARGGSQSATAATVG